MRHELDAGAKRSLEASSVRRTHCAPLEGMQVRPEVRGWIELLRRPEPLEPRLDGPSPKLEIPEHVEALARCVVVEAGELQQGRLVGITQTHSLHEPLPPPSSKDLT